MRILGIATLSAVLALATIAHAERLTDQPLVDPAWLKSHLGNKSLVILDVRDAGKDGVIPYDRGHIPGAVNSPYSNGWRVEVNGVPGMLPPVEQISKLIGDLGIDNDDHVVIVPTGVDVYDFGSAARIYWTFKVLGHPAVSILDGGARGWEKAGGEISTEAVKPKPTTFKADIQHQYLATVTDVEKAVKDGTKLVDSRPAPQFRGEVKHRLARAPGAIPGSVNIEFMTMFDPGTSKVASRQTIARIAEDVGISGDEKTITYCNTGDWATVTWFGLSEVLGKKNATMYDGSYVEWAQDPAHPLRTGK